MSHFNQEKEYIYTIQRNNNISVEKNTFKLNEKMIDNFILTRLSCPIAHAFNMKNATYGQDVESSNHLSFHRNRKQCLVIVTCEGVQIKSTTIKGKSQTKPDTVEAG